MTLTFTTGSAGLDASMALQIATFLVATVGPVLAYRYARKLAISANRQEWLDALRQDLASLIALADSVAALWIQWSHTEDEKASAECQHLFREKSAELQAARFRIRLRLRSGNPDHVKLIDAIAVLCASSRLSGLERKPLRDEVVTIAEGIILNVWRRIERGG